MARSWGCARRTGQRDRRELQRLAERLHPRRHLQGQLSRNDDRRHRRVPLGQAAGNPAGVRRRHRDDDGGQGGDRAGAGSDGRGRGAVRSQRLSGRGRRLLHDARRQDAVDAVQQLDAGSLLQQGGVREGGARSQQSAEDLARGRRGRQEDRRRGVPLRVQHRLAVVDPTGELQRLAQRAVRHQGKRFRRDRCGVRVQQPAACEAHPAAGRLAEGQDLRLRRPSQPRQRQVHQRRMRDVYGIVGRLCRIQGGAPSSRSAPAICPIGRTCRARRRTPSSAAPACG